jgi:hypothetical protein
MLCSVQVPLSTSEEKYKDLITLHKYSNPLSTMALLVTHLKYLHFCIHLLVSPAALFGVVYQRLLSYIHIKKLVASAPRDSHFIGTGL